MVMETIIVGKENEREKEYNAKDFRNIPYISFGMDFLCNLFRCDNDNLTLYRER